LTDLGPVEDLSASCQAMKSPGSIRWEAASGHRAFRWPRLIAA